MLLALLVVLRMVCSLAQSLTCVLWACHDVGHVTCTEASAHDLRLSSVCQVPFRV